MKINGKKKEKSHIYVINIIMEKTFIAIDNIDNYTIQYRR